MIGILLAICSAIFISLFSIINKFVLKEGGDYLVYGFIWNIVPAVILMIALILFYRGQELIFDSSLTTYLLPLISSIFWALSAIVGFYALSLLDVSLKAPLDQLLIIFLTLFSYFILKENITLFRLLGILLVFSGSVLITLGKIKMEKFQKRIPKGIILTISAALFIATAMIIDRIAINHYDLNFYLTLIYFIPAVIILGIIFIEKKVNELLKLAKGKDLFLAITATTLALLSYYCIMESYYYIDVTVTMPIVQTNIIIIEILGILLLKERKKILKKVIGSLIIFAGAVLVNF